MQKQERRLLRLLEQGPERTLLRGLDRVLLRAHAREPVRKQDRRLLRREDRVRVRAQVQCRNRVLLGYEYRRPVRGPVMGPERLPAQRPERLRFPALLRPQGRGPVRGQGFPQPSGEREKLGQCRSQNTDTRSQNSLKEKDLRYVRGRSQKPDVRWQKSEAPVTQ